MKAKLCFKRVEAEFYDYRRFTLNNYFKGNLIINLNLKIIFPFYILMQIENFC